MTQTPDASTQTSPQLAHLTPSQGKILEMLGRGYSQVIVADTVGVTEGYVSQLLSEDWFAQEVQRKKFEYMQKHTLLDDKYDTLEERLLGKLDKSVSMLIKPMDIAKVLQVINGAKRKGVQQNDPATLVQNIVQLNIPVQLAQKFITNANSQVVEIQHGEDTSQPLVTIANGSLERLAREVKEVSGARVIESGGGGSSQDSHHQGGETISKASLEERARIQAAQAGLSKGIPRTQQVTAEDL